MPPAATLLALRPRPGHGSKLHVCWNRRPVPKCHRRPHDGGTEQASLRPGPLHGRKSPPPTTAAVSTVRPDPGGRGLTPAPRAPCPHRRRALCWGPADKQPASRGEGGAGRGGQAGSEGRRKHPGCPAGPPKPCPRAERRRPGPPSRGKSNLRYPSPCLAKTPFRGETSGSDPQPLSRVATL